MNSTKDREYKITILFLEKIDVVAEPNPRIVYWNQTGESRETKLAGLSK